MPTEAIRQPVGKHAYFPGVDLIRFCAALLVVADHLGGSVWVWRENPVQFITHLAPRSPPASWLVYGDVGVPIFFVISGLVIANSAVGETAGAFLKSRVLRLYPAVWICATLTLIIALSFGAGNGIFLNYLCSMALLPIPIRLVNVYWTLAVEIGFYTLVMAVRALAPTIKPQYIATGLLLYNAGYLVLHHLGLRMPPDVVRPLLLEDGIYFSLGIFFWLGTTSRRFSGMPLDRTGSHADFPNSSQFDLAINASYGCSAIGAALRFACRAVSWADDLSPLSCSLSCRGRRLALSHADRAFSLAAVFDQRPFRDPCFLSCCASGAASACLAANTTDAVVRSLPENVYPVIRMRM